MAEIRTIGYDDGRWCSRTGSGSQDALPAAEEPDSSFLVSLQILAKRPCCARNKALRNSASSISRTRDLWQSQ